MSLDQIFYRDTQVDKGNMAYHSEYTIQYLLYYFH
jgi:hypothetical protein